MLVLALILFAETYRAVAGTHQPGDGQGQERFSLLTPEQLIQMLDETVDWYRTLGTQQQSATQPSDLLLFYANQQTAEQVVELTFQIARANAELLSNEARSTGPTDSKTSSDSITQHQQDAARKSQTITTEMQSTRRQLNAVSAHVRTDLQAKLDELQGELAMVKAQQNLLDTMAQFINDNDTRTAGIRALKARIDAIAATIPSLNAAQPSSPSPQPAGARPGNNASSQSAAANVVAPRDLGIWDLADEVFKLLQKLHSINALNQGTRALQQTFQKIRDPANKQLRSLSERADALATAADTANGSQLMALRDQFDQLAWLFTQTSAIAVPLSKVNVLLTQYRDNLNNWRSAVKRQNRDVLELLGIRLAALIIIVTAVLVGSELWRRAVVRYAHDMRHRNQLLLVRRIVTWILIVLILGLMLFTHISSFATFAGLLTAGLAVAMQSVLVSMVGYFLLIGRYGVRVGDRVQIGEVNGEVIALGLIRMQILELAGQGTLTPTGRVVAVANSVVFQSTGGLVRQIPGVNFTWHVLTLDKPSGIDYGQLKERLLAKLTEVVNEHRSDIVRQAETIQQTAVALETTDVTPQVQLQYGTSGVQIKVRYPVPLSRAAQVDEQVSLALHEVISHLSAENRNEAGGKADSTRS